MARNFKAIISGREHLLIRMSGDVNETADFGPIRFAKRLPVEIDVGELTSINSMGVREWVEWASHLENLTIEISHCPKFFIDQLNMIPGFLPSTAKILSFYVPYFCAEKEIEKRVLFGKGLEFERRADGEIILRYPKVTDDQNNVYELDVVPDRYFKFLNRHG